MRLFPVLLLVCFCSCSESVQTIFKKDTKALEKQLECDMVTYSFSYEKDGMKDSRKSITFKVLNPKKVDISNIDSCRKYTNITIDYFWNELTANKNDVFSNIKVLFTSSTIEQGVSGSFAEIMNAMIAYHLETGNENKAMEVANALVASSPKDADYYVVRARVHLQNEAYKKAIADLEMSNGLKPENNTILESLAYVYTLDSAYQKAANICRNLLDKDFLNEEATLNLAYVNLQMNKPNETLSLLNGISSLSENVSRRNYMLSETYLQLGKTDSAKAIISRLVLNDSSASVIKTIGKICVREKKMKEACENFRNAANKGDEEAAKLWTQYCK